jgi:uncharacterized membrane protein YgcG
MVNIAVVGGCGSGKTTIVSELCARGYHAYVVGQEHSEIATLWNRRNPDAVVFLEVTLEAVRHRRDENWPEWLFEKQRLRLDNAYRSATIRVSTADLTVDETVASIVEAISAVNASGQSSSSSSSPAGSSSGSSGSGSSSDSDSPSLSSGSSSLAS